MFRTCEEEEDGEERRKEETGNERKMQEKAPRPPCSQLIGLPTSGSDDGAGRGQLPTHPPPPFSPSPISPAVVLVLLDLLAPRVRTSPRRFTKVSFAFSILNPNLHQIRSIFTPRAQICLLWI
nr:unnamed protein product [Digitaria exilis]